MDAVHRNLNEIDSVAKFLDKSESISELLYFKSLAAKSLLLMCASSFEAEICDALKLGIKSASGSDVWENFIHFQALHRKFHSLFDWDSSNINKFLKLFGKDFKSKFESIFTEMFPNNNLDESVRDFMFIGSTRNVMVHSDFGAYSLDVTIEEIVKKKDSALLVVEALKKALII